MFEESLQNCLLQCKVNLHKEVHNMKLYRSASVLSEFPVWQVGSKVTNQYHLCFILWAYYMMIVYIPYIFKVIIVFKKQ